MTDSVDPKRRTESKEELKARLSKLNPGTPPNERESVTELPRWVKTALIFKELYGESYNSAAERCGFKGSTLSNYAKSPAAKKWREEIRSFADDPIAVSKAILAGNALGITLDRLTFLDMAKAAGDYSEGDKIARDIQDRIGITKKTQKDQGAMVINLQLPAGATSIEVPEISATHEALEEPEADFEIVEDDD